MNIKLISVIALILIVIAGSIHGSDRLAHISDVYNRSTKRVSIFTTGNYQLIPYTSENSVFLPADPQGSQKNYLNIRIPDVGDVRLYIRVDNGQGSDIISQARVEIDGGAVVLLNDNGNVGSGTVGIAGNLANSYPYVVDVASNGTITVKPQQR